MANVNIQTIAANTGEEQISYYLKLLGSKKVMDKLIKDSGGGGVVDCHSGFIHGATVLVME